jgi:hypothetical protein
MDPGHIWWGHSSQFNITPWCKPPAHGRNAGAIAATRHHVERMAKGGGEERFEDASVRDHVKMRELTPTQTHSFKDLTPATGVRPAALLLGRSLLLGFGIWSNHPRLLERRDARPLTVGQLRMLGELFQCFKRGLLDHVVYPAIAILQVAHEGF